MISIKLFMLLFKSKKCVIRRGPPWGAAANESVFVYFILWIMEFEKFELETMFSRFWRFYLSFEIYYLRILSSCGVKRILSYIIIIMIMLGVHSPPEALSLSRDMHFRGVVSLF